MSWKCKEGCMADCCGPVPIPIELYKKIKHKAQCEITQEFPVHNSIIPIGRTRSCVFLAEDFKCAIYEDRPQVFRRYGRIEELQCPYVKLNGNLRSPAQVRRQLRKINHFVDHCFDSFGD